MSRRRSHKTRRVWIGRLILLALFLATASLALYGYQTYGKRWLLTHVRQIVRQLSPTIKEVEILADTTLQSPQLKQYLKHYLQDQKGKPLLEFSKRETLGKISQLSFIEKVDLERFFDGTLRLHLQVRKPIAVLQKPPNFMDRQGTVFTLPQEDIEAALAERLPVITGIPEHWFTVKNVPPQSQMHRRMLLETAADLLVTTAPMLAPYADRITGLNLDPEGGYSLATERFGGNIVFGMPPFATKQQRLAKILARFAQETQPLAAIALVDLDFRQQAYVRFQQQKKVE